MRYSLEMDESTLLWCVSLYGMEEYMDTKYVFNSAKEAEEWVEKGWPGADHI